MTKQNGICAECENTGELEVRIKRADGTSYVTTEACHECCEHGEYDHGICYDCGKDCMEDLIGRAEDYYEGDR